jgi:hypothetical protein
MIFPKKEILYAPMLGTLGGASARSFGRGLGGSASGIDAVDYFGDGSGVAFLNFENDLDDVGGNYSSTGSSVSRTPLSGVTSIGSKALRLTNTASYLQTTFSQPTGTYAYWTFSFWFRRSNDSALSSNNRMIDFREWDTSKGTTIVYESDGSFNFVLRNNQNSNSIKIEDANFLCNNNWKHIVVGSNNGNAFCYYNNSARTASTGNNRSDSQETSGIKIGYGYGGGMGGEITHFENVRLFNKALTSSEVTDLYTTEGAAFA